MNPAPVLQIFKNSIQRGTQHRAALQLDPGATSAHFSSTCYSISDNDTGQNDTSRITLHKITVGHTTLSYNKSHSTTTI